MPFSLMQGAVVPALPTLQRELGSTTAWTAWTVTIFLVVAAVTTPLLSRLGDQHGQAKLLLVSLGVFIVGAIGATFAWDIASLIAFRAVQGASGAALPLAFALAKELLPARRVGFAMGVMISSSAVASGTGLLLGGVIIDHLSWPWLFAIGAIIGGLAAAAVRAAVRDRLAAVETRLDIPGALLLMSGLTALMLALTQGPDLGWAAPATLALFAGAVLLLAVWVAVERRVPVPLVDVRMLTGRTVLLTNVATLVGGFAMFSTFIIVPVLVQAPRGLSDDVARLVDYGFDGSSTLTGLLIVPASVSIFVAGLSVGPLLRRVRPAVLFSVGMVVMALGLAAMAVWHAAEWQLALTMVPWGLGMGVVLSLSPLLITNAVRETETAVAVGMNATVRVIGSVIGGQVAAALLASVTFPATDVPRGSALTGVFAMSALAALLASAAAVLIGRRSRPRGQSAGDEGALPWGRPGVTNR